MKDSINCEHCGFSEVCKVSDIIEDFIKQCSKETNLKSKELKNLKSKIINIIAKDCNVLAIQSKGKR